MSSDLELAERAARAAGEVLMTYYGRAPEGLDSKTSATDPVSDADREAMLASIGASTKAHGLDVLPGAADRGDFDPTSSTVVVLLGCPPRIRRCSARNDSTVVG